MLFLLEDLKCISGLHVPYRHRGGERGSWVLCTSGMVSHAEWVAANPWLYSRNKGWFSKGQRCSRAGVLYQTSSPRLEPGSSPVLRENPQTQLC